jgi:cytochrome P450
MATSDTPSPVVVGANPADQARNRAMGAGLVDDPYPRYDELRASGPVHEGTIAAHFGVPEYTTARPPGRDFTMYDWATVDQVLRDDETFSNASYAPLLEAQIGPTILQMDGREHRRYRGLAQPGFARSDMARWQATWVQPYVDELLDEIAADAPGPVDLYLRLCARMPVHTIAMAWGVAEDDIPRVHELAVRQLSPGGDPAPAVAAATEIAVLLRDEIARRRVDPGDDLISLMCAAELVDDDGAHHHLDDDEILAFARLLLTAGAGTTFRGLGCLLVALLADREQYTLVRDDRRLVERAVEEALRWEQPLSAVTRLVVRDCEVGGVAIPAGSRAHACLGAANHDPARWDDPHRFDVRRPALPHATFGGGPHFCLGVHLARMEMKVALDAILDRLPDLRLDPDQPAPHITGLTFRLPTGVPVVWG